MEPCTVAGNPPGNTGPPSPSPAPGPIGACTGTVVVAVAVGVFPLTVIVPQLVTAPPATLDWSTVAQFTEIDV